MPSVAAGIDVYLLKVIKRCSNAFSLALVLAPLADRPSVSVGEVRVKVTKTLSPFRLVPGLRRAALTQREKPAPNASRQNGVDEATYKSRVDAGDLPGGGIVACLATVGLTIPA